LQMDWLGRLLVIASLAREALGDGKIGEGKPMVT